MVKISCQNCGSAKIRFRVRTNETVCDRCGHVGKPEVAELRPEMVMSRCPGCNIAQGRYRSKLNQMICNACGHTWRTPEMLAAAEKSGFCIGCGSDKIRYDLHEDTNACTKCSQPKWRAHREGNPIDNPPKTIV